MGEKQIVTGGGGTPGSGTPGGGTTGGGGTGKPGGLSTTAAGGGAPPRTQTRPPGTPPPGTEADLCSDIKKKQAALLDQLQRTANENRDAASRADQAFFGAPGAPTASGYADAYTKAKITEAVVDANNAVGKQLIDAAMFAAGGFGGIAYSSGAVEAEGALGGFAGFAEGAFGKGMAGAKDVADVYGKIGLKVAEKIGDAAADYKAGKAGSALGKTIEKLGGDHPDDWIQGPFGYLESVARGKAIDALGDWMKEGAMAGDLDRAKAAYVDFALAAQTANVSAAAAHQLKDQLVALNKEAAARGCPEVAIPAWLIFTFDPAVFGAGPSVGEAGPTITRELLDSGTTQTFDLFASQTTNSSFPGM